MGKQQKIQTSKALIGLFALTMATSACTKQRKAELPEDQQRKIFAISDFGTVKSFDSEFFVETENHKVELSRSESVQAINESGKINIKSAQVPKRLRYMFADLQITGSKEQKLPITFSVDRKYVTAYKVVRDLRNVSPIERQFAKIQEEVRLRNEISRLKDKSLRSQKINALKKLQDQIDLAEVKTKAYLIPIFKYEVTSYGVLERVKNELKEETSTLKIRATAWENATHIVISEIKDQATPVDVNEDEKENLARTYSLSSLQNKIYTTSELNALFQVRLDLDKNAKIHTLVDDEGLSIFEIKDKTKLSPAEKDEFEKTKNTKNFISCNEEITKSMSREEAGNCITIHRFIVPVDFTKYTLPKVSNYGEESPVLKVEKTDFAQNEGLVQIRKYVEPTRVTEDFVQSSRSLIATKSLINKEFFFRRTLQDSPSTASFLIGESSELILVKFHLENNRLVVRRSESVITHQRGSNELDREEIMSLPVKYYRNEFVDAKGAKLAYPRWVVTSKEKAEYVFMDWSNNTLSSVHSPLSAYGSGQCIAGIGDLSMQDVDNRLSEGVLNFSYGYSVTLRAELGCLGLYNASNSYDPSGLKVQFNANLKERVSFVLNDGRTEQTFGSNLPFDIQRSMGYGVWTLGRLKPTENGTYGREGSQQNLNVKHDFRNGRQLIYTVTGLPTNDPSRRELFANTLKEVVAAWNLAYVQAFKGSSLERSDRTYIKLEIPNEGEEFGQLGDLDKNIIHFDNKFNDNHGVLGISQVGYNPRSGVVVADSLIIHAGNLTKFVEASRRNVQNALKWDAEKKVLHEVALKQFEDEAKAKSEENKVAPQAGAEGAKTQLVKMQASLEKMALQVNARLNKDTALAGKNLTLRSSNLLQRKMMAEKSKQKINTLKNSGTSKFKFAASQIETAYIERTIKRISESSNRDSLDIEGILAEEMLASSGNKISQIQRAHLEKRAALGKFRSQMKNRFKSMPGCALTVNESLEMTFTEATFEESLKKALYFDIAHEMGHSQGLTHNFAGSFDKANFNRPGENSRRNYSSVMDYISPEHFSWDGIGTYDIRTLRATHTGLVPLSSQGLTLLSRYGLENVTNGQEVNLLKLESAVGKKGGWNKFPQKLFTVSVNASKYCTDIDVGYEPTCQRFDTGTTATEIVKNLIREHEQFYINAYHSWDRLEFSYRNKINAINGSMNIMFNMRHFLDEYFYKAYIEQAPEEELNDYRNAANLAMNFIINMVRTPTKFATFMDQERFAAKTITVEEPVLDDKGNNVLEADGKPKVTTKVDAVIVEYRALDDILVNKDRIDTIGLLPTKITALQLLTMQGFPSYKYASYNLSMSFLDLDMELAGGDTNSMITLSTLTGAIRGQLMATHQMPNGSLIALGFNAESNDTIRLYGSIQAILGLESPALRQADNFANFFKVGTSIGKSPTDRASTSSLEGKENSSVKMHYWALDNSPVSDMLITDLMVNRELNQFGSDKYAGPEIKALAGTYADMIGANFLLNFSSTVKTEEEKSAIASAAKAKMEIAQKNLKGQQQNLVKKLAAIAANNEIYKQTLFNDSNSVQSLASGIENLIKELVVANLQTGISLTYSPEDAQQKAIQQIMSMREKLAASSQQSPILGGVVVAINEALQDYSKELIAKNQALLKGNPGLSQADTTILTVEVRAIQGGAYVAQQLFSTNLSEISFAKDMRILDFMARLTLMTNPELNR